jgi:2',3'-cyclic-nucleotide 2'-phosphodiesterase / 3'-nucleotidase
MVMYHGGIERDFTDGHPTETLTGENVGYQMCGLDGFDILVTGHQHRSFVTQINGKIVAQCKANASEFIKIDIDVKLLVTVEDMSQYAIDHQIEPLVSLLEKQTQIWLRSAIGQNPSNTIFTNPRRFYGTASKASHWSVSSIRFKKKRPVLS